MKLDGIVRAHEFMHIERPHVLWEADTQDEVFIRLLGEMIAFALQRSPNVSTLTLNVANVVVDPTPPERACLKAAPLSGSAACKSILCCWDLRASHILLRESLPHDATFFESSKSH